MKNLRQTTYFPLQGGEDLETPLYRKQPGSLKQSQNFECDYGGRYARIDGYERYDGQTKPSEASYWILNFDAGVAGVSEGDTVTGGTSGATGVALIDGVVESGAYVTSDADGYLVLTEVSGTFQDDENLEVSGTVCVADGTAAERSSSTSDTTWLRDAIETARSEISAVPGSGDIQGVWMYDGDAYAFRADTAGAETCLYVSSTAGWTKVDLGSEIAFDAGTAEFDDGSTLSGTSSGASATIGRVVLQSGSWGSDAEGYMSLTSVTGSFNDNETITTTGGGSATAASTDSEISLTTGGRFEFINNNFYGHSSTRAMYGCDGVNYAFEYNGTAFTQIKTGMTTDTPSHIYAHYKHLFLTFPGGSLQHSTLGEPLEWSGVTGASELGLGSEIVGLTGTPGETLVVHGRNSLSILYGTSVADWELKEFSKVSGAIEWSIQKLSDVFFFDDRGIMSLATAFEHGDFSTAVLSKAIQSVLLNRKTSFVSSIRVKNKDHYRLYFSNNTGINMTITDEGKVGFTRLAYDHKVCCTCSGEDSNNDEILLFGSDNGMVYEMDSGTSFDGEAIQCYLVTWLNTIKSPQRKKRFFKLEIEKDSFLTEGFWGIDNWDEFKWGNQGYQLTYQSNISYIDFVDVGYEYSYTASETHEAPYTLQGIVLHYSNGGITR